MAFKTGAPRVAPSAYSEESTAWSPQKRQASSKLASAGDGSPLQKEETMLAVAAVAPKGAMAAIAIVELPAKESTAKGIPMTGECALQDALAWEAATPSMTAKSEVEDATDREIEQEFEKTYEEEVGSLKKNG